MNNLSNIFNFENLNISFIKYIHEYMTIHFTYKNIMYLIHILRIVVNNYESSLSHN